MGKAQMTQEELVAARWRQVCSKGDLAQLKRLLADPAQASKRLHGLWWAARSGQTECVRLLMEHVDASGDDSRALDAAVSARSPECLELLLSSAEPKARDSKALALAAKRGELACVRLLAPRSDPLANGSWALKEAAICGQIDCVKLLLPLSEPCDPGPQGKSALELAREQRGRWPQVAALIEAFVEARELGAVAKQAARGKDRGL